MKKYSFFYNFKLFIYCRINQRWLFLSIIDIKMDIFKNIFFQYFNDFLKISLKIIKLSKILILIIIYMLFSQQIF